MNHHIKINQAWNLFHKTHDKFYRDILIDHYYDLVRYAAERLHAKLPDKVELDDLISAGTFGLMDAIDAYDPERGVKFETYCAPRIKGSILDELRSMDWVPRLVRARAHQLSLATLALEVNLGRKPLEEELAHEMDLPMEEFVSLKKDTKAVGLVSLSELNTKNSIDKQGSNIDKIIHHKSNDTLIEAQKYSLKRLLTQGLTRAERLIIVLYYYEELTMKEISSTLDLSEYRVRQIHSSTIAKLKGSLNDIEDVYENHEPPQRLVHVVQTINREILNYLKKHPHKLHSLKPRQFEGLIAEILASFGWKVQLTQPTRDGGYDIYAITREPIAGVETSWIIECKKYAATRKVGIDIIRKLHSVKISKNIGCMMLATTSDFTRDVQAFKKSRYDLELKCYEEIIEWINEYRPNPNGQLYLKDNKLILP